MKKIFYVFTLIAGLSFAGLAQKTEKLLKANRWFATGTFNGKNITLSKKSPDKPDWDAKFADGSVMNYCSVLKAPLVNTSGIEEKAGTYYCDPSYTYEIKGDLLHIKYPLVDWYYIVKKLPNGDLELVYTADVGVIKGDSKK